MKPMQYHLSEFNASHKGFHTLLQTCKTSTQHFPLCGQELQRQKYLEFVHQVFLVFIAKTLPALQPHMEHDRKFAEAFLFVPHAQSTNHEMAVKFVWEVNRLHAVKGLCLLRILAQFKAYTLPFLTHTLCMYLNTNHGISICICSLFTKLSATRAILRRMVKDELERLGRPPGHRISGIWIRDCVMRRDDLDNIAKTRNATRVGRQTRIIRLEESITTYRLI